jgi:hypothetical protein
MHVSHTAGTGCPELQREREEKIEIPECHATGCSVQQPWTIAYLLRAAAQHEGGCARFGAAREEVVPLAAHLLKQYILSLTRLSAYMQLRRTLSPGTLIKPHGQLTCFSWNWAQVPRAESLRPFTVVCTCAPVACDTRCRSSSVTWNIAMRKTAHLLPA